MTTSKLKSIVLRDEEVQSLIRDGEAVLWRPVKPQPPPDRDKCWVEYPHGKPMAVYRSFPGQGSARTGLCECPLGAVGERRAVRETWALVRPYFDCEAGCVDEVDEWTGAIPKSLPDLWVVWYAADSGDIDEHPDDRWVKRYRPSTTMPLWACRLAVEITAVAVERAGETWEWVVGAKRVELE